MANYNFRKFFEVPMCNDVPIHNNEYVSNGHFLIKKSELKKNQLDFVNTFALTDSINDQFNQIVKNESSKKTIIEFEPERMFKGEDYNVLIMNHIAINETYYNFIQSLKCRIFITESDRKHNLLSIYNNNHEFVGVLLPIRLGSEIEESIEYDQYLEELKLEQECKQITKLMKPLFVNGMYNREGKRIRASYLKTISHNNNEYPLWVASGKPDKDYAKNENDKYYLHIQVNDWLIMIGFTEYELKQRAGYEYLNKEWYGDFEGRSEYFNEHFYNGRTYEEYGDLIKEHIKKEEAFIEENSNNEVIQAEFISQFVDKAIKNYIDARDNNGKFADFQGAAFLNELDKCAELALKLRKEREEREQQKRKEVAEQKEKEIEEQKQTEKLLIEKAEDTFINGGIIEGGEVIVKLADKYNVNIPLRTRGWILKNLIESDITNDGGVGYRFWKSKNGKGSQTVYRVLHDIRNAIMA